ncbi:calcium/sodium antiporter [archaeon]|jgi:cation:H+ antiporter|nr:calcium/sodium antiporter [archaeon]MBT6182943.1 calcium/sodium antiporter [archaeon]MBT6606592.1 calcium/sodium antiporter [archaeon]MBT7251781.1 calcium/sodium antiporter [archaeon]MBT7660802.1 calcium/sodium antiporter [archaeon]
MVTELILFLLGLYMLVKSSNLIVKGSTSLAHKLGVSALVIGLTVVAFGTSLPELVVNIFAAINNNPDLIFGNIIGSNIANILLVLGISAIVGTVTIRYTTVWKTIPFALVSSFILFILVSKVFIGDFEGPYLTRINALILLALFGMFIYSVLEMIKNEKSKVPLLKPEKDDNYKIALKLLLGIVGIFIGAKLVLEGVINLSRIFGISEFLISATAIALGTSLPELAVSINAVLKGKVDLAVGNIIGSNIFNILWVLGIAALIRPIKIPDFILFDISVMFFATLLLFVFIFVRKKHQLTRKSGIVFVILYLLYISFILIRG